MIGRWGSAWLIIIVLLGWLSSWLPAEAAGPEMLATPVPAPEAEAVQQLRSAQRTQQTTRGTLRVLGGGSRCAEPRFVSYNRSGGEPDVVAQWYRAFQRR